jgi:hypothetical protein
MTAPPDLKFPPPRLPAGVQPSLICPVEMFVTVVPDEVTSKSITSS